jgi:uncharacterized membrane protein YhhN
MKSKLLFIILFTLISLIEIFADLTGRTMLVYIFKPLIILSLISFVLLYQGLPKTKYQRFYFIGLIFALFGDIFLMIRGTDLFIPGLASFLVMQLLYIATFRMDISSPVFQKKYLVRALPFLAFALTLYLTLFPKLPDSVMRSAVAIYALSIATMSWMALLRKSFVSKKSFGFVFAGAVLFMISDSFIAVNRFLISIPLNTIWVMSTYAAAQYLIVMGITKMKQAGQFD